MFSSPVTSRQQQSLLTSLWTKSNLFLETVTIKLESNTYRSSDYEVTYSTLSFGSLLAPLRTTSYSTSSEDGKNPPVFTGMGAKLAPLRRVVLPVQPEVDEDEEEEDDEDGEEMEDDDDDDVADDDDNQDPIRPLHKKSPLVSGFTSTTAPTSSSLYCASTSTSEGKTNYNNRRNLSAEAQKTDKTISVDNHRHTNSIIPDQVNARLESMEGLPLSRQSDDFGSFTSALMEPSSHDVMSMEMNPMGGYLDPNAFGGSSLDFDDFGQSSSLFDITHDSFVNASSEKYDHPTSVPSGSSNGNINGNGNNTSQHTIKYEPSTIRYDQPQQQQMPPQSLPPQRTYVPTYPVKTVDASQYGQGMRNMAPLPPKAAAPRKPTAARTTIHKKPEPLDPMHVEYEVQRNVSQILSATNRQKMAAEAQQKTTALGPPQQVRPTFLCTGCNKQMSSSRNLTRHRQVCVGLAPSPSNTSMPPPLTPSQLSTTPSSPSPGHFQLSNSHTNMYTAQGPNNQTFLSNGYDFKMSDDLGYSDWSRSESYSGPHSVAGTDLDLSDTLGFTEQLRIDPIEQQKREEINTLDPNPQSNLQMSLDTELTMPLSLEVDEPVAHSSSASIASSSIASGSQGTTPQSFTCESCKKAVSSSRSLKRHHTTCKSHIAEFGISLEESKQPKPAANPNAPKKRTNKSKSKKEKEKEELSGVVEKRMEALTPGASHARNVDKTGGRIPVVHVSGVLRLSQPGSPAVVQGRFFNGSAEQPGEPPKKRSALMDALNSTDGQQRKLSAPLCAPSTSQLPSYQNPMTSRLLNVKMEEPHQLQYTSNQQQLQYNEYYSNQTFSHNQYQQGFTHPSVPPSQMQASHNFPTPSPSSGGAGSGSGGGGGGLPSITSSNWFSSSTSSSLPTPAPTPSTIASKSPFEQQTMISPKVEDIKKEVADSTECDCGGVHEKTEDGECLPKAGLAANTCEDCSRQLCSASNLKRHRATCKMVLQRMSGSNSTSQPATPIAPRTPLSVNPNMGGPTSSLPSGGSSVNSNPSSIHPPPAATVTYTKVNGVSWSSSSSSSEKISVAQLNSPRGKAGLTASVPAGYVLPEQQGNKPWITVGEHLRAQHVQQQKMIEQQNNMQKLQYQQQQLQQQQQQQQQQQHQNQHQNQHQQNHHQQQQMQSSQSQPQNMNMMKQNQNQVAGNSTNRKFGVVEHQNNDSVHITSHPLVSDKQSFVSSFSDFGSDEDDELDDIDMEAFDEVMQRDAEMYHLQQEAEMRERADAAAAQRSNQAAQNLKQNQSQNSMSSEQQRKESTTSNVVMEDYTITTMANAKFPPMNHGQDQNQYSQMQNQNQNQNHHQHVQHQQYIQHQQPQAQYRVVQAQSQHQPQSQHQSQHQPQHQHQIQIQHQNMNMNMNVQPLNQNHQNAPQSQPQNPPQNSTTSKKSTKAKKEPSSAIVKKIDKNSKIEIMSDMSHKSVSPLDSIITSEPLPGDAPTEKKYEPAQIKNFEPVSIEVAPLIHAKPPPKKQQEFQCPECLKTYSCRKNVKRHRMAVHKLTPEEIARNPAQAANSIVSPNTTSKTSLPPVSARRHTVAGSAPTASELAPKMSAPHEMMHSPNFGAGFGNNGSSNNGAMRMNQPKPYLAPIQVPPPMQSTQVTMLSPSLSQQLPMKQNHQNPQPQQLHNQPSNQQRNMNMNQQQHLQNQNQNQNQNHTQMQNQPHHQKMAQLPSHKPQQLHLHSAPQSVAALPGGNQMVSPRMSTDSVMASPSWVAPASSTSTWVRARSGEYVDEEESKETARIAAELKRSAEEEMAEIEGKRPRAELAEADTTFTEENEKNLLSNQLPPLSSLSSPCASQNHSYMRSSQSSSTSLYRTSSTGMASSLPSIGNWNDYDRRDSYQAHQQPMMVPPLTHSAPQSQQHPQQQLHQQQQQHHQQPQPQQAQQIVQNTQQYAALTPMQHPHPHQQQQPMLHHQPYHQVVPQQHQQHQQLQQQQQQDQKNVVILQQPQQQLQPQQMMSRQSIDDNGRSGSVGSIDGSSVEVPVKKKKIHTCTGCQKVLSSDYSLRRHRSTCLEVKSNQANKAAQLSHRNDQLKKAMPPKKPSTVHKEPVVITSASLSDPSAPPKMISPSKQSLPTPPPLSSSSSSSTSTVPVSTPQQQSQAPARPVAMNQPVVTPTVTPQEPAKVVKEDVDMKPEIDGEVPDSTTSQRHDRSTSPGYNGLTNDVDFATGKEIVPKQKRIGTEVQQMTNSGNEQQNVNMNTMTVNQESQQQQQNQQQHQQQPTDLIGRENQTSGGQYWQEWK